MPKLLATICEHTLAKHPAKKLKVQVSLGGPEPVHDEIRKMRRGYEKAMKSFEQLIQIKEKHKNPKYTTAIRSCGRTWNPSTC
jgi:sulfatase maturation enzyme AslB (radical SAM superfamily)